VFLTVVLDSLKLLELANLAQTDVQLVLSQDNAKFAIKDTSYTRTNVLLPVLKEPSEAMEDALPAQTDVLAVMSKNALYAKRVLTYITVAAYQSAPE
jgi:hypothetical protein